MAARRPFQIVPAVDVLGDEAVRLTRGAFDGVSVRAGSPVALARRLAAAGAQLVHLVDLDGARRGRIRPELVARVAAAVRPVAVQASGGVRSPTDAERLLAAGATRVVVGTAAFADAAAPARYAAALGNRLVVALDARDGRIAADGWTRERELTVAEAAERCAAAGVARVLCTAIERDGTLGGPDLPLLRRVVDRFGGPVLAAGGIATSSDLDAVAGTGCEAAVVGRALIDGSLPLELLERGARRGRGRPT